MPDGDSLPSPDRILIAHEAVEQAWDMSFTGTRVAAPRQALREVLARARKYDDLYARAACLLRSLITAHLFEDGNKRTAWIVTRQYLDEHSIEPAELRTVVVAHVLRSIRSYDVAEIATWLETGDIDRTRLNP